MSQTSSDNMKVVSETSTTRTLTDDRRKSKKQKNRGNQSQWTLSRNYPHPRTLLPRFSTTAYG